jgi:hypothetical protein
MQEQQNKTQAYCKWIVYLINSEWAEMITYGTGNDI